MNPTEMYVARSCMTIDDTTAAFMDAISQASATVTAMGMLARDKSYCREIRPFGEQMKADAIGGVNQRYRKNGEYPDRYVFDFLDFGRCACIDMSWSGEHTYFLLDITGHPGDFLCVEPSELDYCVISDVPERYGAEGRDGAATAVTLKSFHDAFRAVYSEAKAIPRHDMARIGSQDEYDEIMDTCLLMMTACFRKDAIKGYSNAYEDGLLEKEGMEDYIVDFRTLSSNVKPDGGYDFVVIDAAVTPDTRTILFLLQGRKEFAVYSASHNGLIMKAYIEDIRKMVMEDDEDDGQ